MAMFSAQTKNMKNREKKYVHKLLALSALISFFKINAADNSKDCNRLIPLAAKTVEIIGYEAFKRCATPTKGHVLTPAALGQETIYQGNTFLKSTLASSTLACLYGSAAGILTANSLNKKTFSRSCLDLLIGGSFLLTAVKATSTLDSIAKKRELSYYSHNPVTYCTQLGRNFPERDVLYHLDPERLTILLHEIGRREAYQTEERAFYIKKELYNYIPEKGIGKLIAGYAKNEPIEELNHDALEALSLINPPTNWLPGDAITKNNY
jgi:hypothetical protein